MASGAINAALIGGSVTLLVAIGGFAVRLILREVREFRAESAQEHQEVWRAVTDNYHLTKQIAEANDIELDRDPGHPLEGRTFEDDEN